MSHVCLLTLATLLACARAYTDELEVAAFVGGMITLRPLNVQNKLWMHTDTSLPKIWWDFGDIKIDGSTGRYRLLSDGALQIIPLYRNDSGVYTFTALNKFGRITQQIHLVVNGDTTAEGPEQVGYLCRDYQFGCCGDGKTPATGPESAGCDCSSSRHGCCPDGRTAATGPKFLGCTDAPENKQAACSMLADPGPCHNFTAMWFYDLGFGGCSRFWYGGCDGNGNRFSTNEECVYVCEQPSPKDTCKLPSVKGACDGDYQRWYYNSTREQCIPFIYGGCLGNANNFDTRELCQKQCEPGSQAGFQTRNVTREEVGIIVDTFRDDCDEGLKPSTNQSCNTDPCPAQWVEGRWGECSQTCGSGGVRSREVKCQKISVNGVKSIVPDKQCFDLLGAKPEVFQKCNADVSCPTWFVGQWNRCDKLCDEGKQTRVVVCYQKNKDNVIGLLGDESCTEEKPEEEQPCLLQPCDGTLWFTTSWSGCDTCTSKFRTRMVVCATKNMLVVNDSFCSNFSRPVDHEKCNKDELPTCEVQWYTTPWTKCSVKCGEGVQTRKVYCGMYYEDQSGVGVKMVEDAQCANLTKYIDTRPCTVPKECPSQWFAGPWSECTEYGEQYRRVICLQGNKKGRDCNGKTVLDSAQLCNH